MRAKAVAAAFWAVMAWTGSGQASPMQIDFLAKDTITAGTDGAGLFLPYGGSLKGVTLYLSGVLNFGNYDGNTFSQFLSGTVKLYAVGPISGLGGSTLAATSAAADFDFQQKTYDVSFQVAGHDGTVSFSQSLTEAFSYSVADHGSVYGFLGLQKGSGDPFSISLSDSEGTTSLDLDQPFDLDNGASVGPVLPAVPLPATAPLLGAALLGLGAVGYGVKRLRPAARS